MVPRHAGHQPGARLTQAIRAFKRTLALDPDYALAYDHVQHMLGIAAAVHPSFALVAPDSFALARRRRAGPAGQRDAPARRPPGPRAEALATARSWVASQPTTLRAHGAMVDAYIASGNYGAALAEVVRFRQTAPVHPELPFVEARIRFASGEVDRAAPGAPHRARHRGPAGLPAVPRTPTVVTDIAAAANVFAYQGDLASAAKTIDLADQVRREVIKHPGRGEGMVPTRLAPDGAERALRRDRACRPRPSGRSGRAPPRRGGWRRRTQRKHLPHSGASAAIGLFTGPARTAGPDEYRAMTGEQLHPRCGPCWR